MINTGNSKRSGAPPPPPAPPPGRYLDWAIRTGFAYQRTGDWVPLLVQFRRQAVVRDEDIRVNAFLRFQALEWLGEAWREFVKIPALFAKVPKVLAERSAEFDFCMVLVYREKISEVVNDKGWRATIRNAELGPPVAASEQPADFASGTAASSVNPAVEESRSSSITQPPSSPAPAAVPAGGGRVVMAVLDEGIAFAHERFRNQAASRVQYLWKQDGRFGKSPGSWMPGAELTANDITLAISGFSSGRRTDEDRLYQREGEIDFGSDGFKALARRRSHGTHVLDLAAGADPYAAGTDDRPIIAVELPQASVADPAGTVLYGHILLGIFYILFRSESLLRADDVTLPIVVNVSYGPHHGPHDGTSDFERILDLLVDITSGTSTPLHVVLAAGNFRQLQTHVRVAQILSGATQRFAWMLQPEDRTPSFLELWIRSLGTNPARLEVKVVSPSGAMWSVKKDEPSDPDAGKPLRALQLDYSTDPPTRVLISLVAQPTADDPLKPLSLPLAEPGRWTVYIQNVGTDAIELDGWIARDAAIGGRRLMGRQSYFEDATYEKLDRVGRPVEFDPLVVSGGVERRRTLSGIATGDTPHVVGGFRRKPGLPDMPASYSSMGPASRLSPSRDALSGLAPCDDSLTCPGLLASGTRSGSTVAMHGTSVAAPVYSRALADQLGKGVPMVFDSPPLPPKTPSVPVNDVKDVAGQGCLRISPYHDAPVREERP